MVCVSVVGRFVMICVGWVWRDSYLFWFVGSVCGCWLLCWWLLL